MDGKTDIEKLPSSATNDDEAGVAIGEIINVSGHVQELDRNFGFWSICAVSIVADNAWAAGGGSLVVALYDGGAPGVLYEFIVVSLFYFLIGASLAELASAIPSSSSVYHWASVTGGPKYGRVCSWFAGWWNCFAWVRLFRLLLYTSIKGFCSIGNVCAAFALVASNGSFKDDHFAYLAQQTFGTASVSLFGGNAILAIWSLYHPAYVAERWHIFIAYLGVTWLACSIVLFGQRVLPHVENTCAALCLIIWFVSVMVCAIMPSTTGSGYASHSFVWSEWNNQTGYSSNGFVFLVGMLNGAFAIGTPDGCTHLAEEIPHPRRNIPKGIVAQLATGFVTTFVFYIAILYAITSLDSVISSPITELPLAAVYLQATGSKAGTTGLLVIFLIDLIITIPGAYITCGRMLWTLARDDATPFSKTVSRVSPTFRNPFNATLICGCSCTILGCVYIGSATAFNAFVGVFTILTTMSYLAAILPHMISQRAFVIPGPFWMPAPIAYTVMGIACAYIIVFNVIYCFPYALPVNAQTMNYSCLMSGGLTIFVSVWYLWKRTRGYVGPRVVLEASDDIRRGSLVVTSASAGVGEKTA